MSTLPLPARNNRKRKIAILLTIFIVAVMMGGYWFFQRQSPAVGPRPERSIAVLIASAKLKDVPVEVKAPGTLTASATALVTSRIDGQLEKLHFTDGQYVEKGQLLATLDTRAHQATLTQYEGQLAKNSAQFYSEQAKYQRYQQLYAKGAIAHQDLDTQYAVMTSAAGAVKSDRAQIAVAALNVEFGHIRAPFSGYTGLHLIDVGNMVRSSDTTGIVALTQTQPMALTFSVPERYLARIAQKLRQHHPLPVQVWDAFGHTLLTTGEVSYVSNQIDLNTGSIKLKALLSNAEGMLYPNQSTSIVLRLDQLHDAVTVPSAAVQWNDSGSFVYRVDTDNTVHKVAVTVGPATADDTVIEAGVTAGQRVVIQGIDRLDEGTRVKPITRDEQQSSSKASSLSSPSV